MRISCRMTGTVLADLVAYVQPGITTGELDHYAQQRIRELGGKPSFLGYNGFPGAVCISINEEVIHGIPGMRVIQLGDVVSLDIGVYHGGFHGDSAATIIVGTVAPEVTSLVETTRQALQAGLAKVRPGARLSDVSHAIEQTVIANGCSVVRDFVGHGVGRNLHEEPQVPNFGAPGRGPLLKPGMTLAIEPMVNLGGAKVTVLDDKWTVVTLDGKPSAHFEHTVAVLDEGMEILTLPEKKS